MQDQVNIQVEAIKALTREIPLNDFGLPTGVYRTDLLPFHDYVPKGANGSNGAGANGNGAVVDGTFVDTTDLVVLDVEDDADLSVASVLPLEGEIYRIAGFPAKSLRGAFVPLQFDEGFPAFIDGSPFWSRLEFEPLEAFEAFQKYTQMQQGTTASETEEDYDGTEASGLRSISALVSLLHPSGEVIALLDMYQTYYHLYYWGLRAHAYDLFRVAQHHKQQELRAVETQDEHYIMARRLRHKLMKYFENEEDFWDLMTPKVGIDMLKTLVGLERISAGVPAAGPSTTEHEVGKPFEVILKSVANVGRLTASATINEEGEVLDKALRDPAATEVLQELIIRQGI
jgi:hypothetical protein